VRLVEPIEFLAGSFHLKALDVGLLDCSSALGGPGHGGEHELESVFCTGGVRVPVCLLVFLRYPVEYT
jgi:hypothetical protein